MSLAVIFSRAADGIHAPLVSIEVHTSNGLPGMSIVGLPETAVKESKDRVRAAIINAGFEFPIKRVTVNLAPADLPKEGARFDLGIALGILAATDQIPKRELHRYEFLGELGLGGEVRGIRGVLPASLQLRNSDKTLIVPGVDAREAALVEGSVILPANHLLEVCQHLKGIRFIDPYIPEPAQLEPRTELDLSDVQGQHQARRALEIAAAGRHSLLMTGPPGTGKTMLASRLPGILPPMLEEEAIEAAAIQSISNSGFSFSNWKCRSFRAPHHTASAVALVGGGSYPRPGEVSLAHHGVLFLDELPEFERRVLEVLREPLESGQIIISRAVSQIEFPARFQLIVALNPCPCGYLSDPSGRCRCTPDQIQRYRGKISGPLLDRIDIQIEVPKPNTAQIMGQAGNARSREESSYQIRERVIKAHEIQMQRAGKANAHLSSEEVIRHCPIKLQDQRLLAAAIEQMQLSLRAYHRILKVARSIADLEGEVEIDRPHLMEALGYRQFDRPINGAGREEPQNLLGTTL